MFFQRRLCATAKLAAIIVAAFLTAVASAHADILITVVGDSNVNGKGVSRDQAYPALLERALKAKGHDIRVLNSGIDGDTTAGVLGRLSSAVPPDTKVAVVWVGVNDAKRGMPRETIVSNTQEISNRLRKRGIEVIVIRQPDVRDIFDKYPIPGDPEKHITSAGYAALVGRTIGQVEQAIARVKK